jgi:hypothetical protein
MFSLRKLILLQRYTASGLLSIMGIPIRAARYGIHSNVIDMGSHNLAKELK